MKQLNPLQAFERTDHEPYIYKDVWTPEEVASLLALGRADIDLKSWRNELSKRIRLPDDVTKTPFEWDEYFQMEEAYNNMLEVTRSARLLHVDKAPHSPIEWTNWAKFKNLNVAHFEVFIEHSEGNFKGEVDDSNSIFTQEENLAIQLQGEEKQNSKLSSPIRRNELTQPLINLINEQPTCNNSELWLSFKNMALDCALPFFTGEVKDDTIFFHEFTLMKPLTKSAFLARVNRLKKQRAKGP